MRARRPRRAADGSGLIAESADSRKDSSPRRLARHLGRRVELAVERPRHRVRARPARLVAAVAAAGGDGLGSRAVSARTRVQGRRRRRRLGHLSRQRSAGARRRQQKPPPRRRVRLLPAGFRRRAEPVEPRRQRRGRPRRLVLQLLEKRDLLGLRVQQLPQLRVLLLERRVRRAVEEARKHRVLRHEARAASVELYCELAHDAAERDALLAEAVELGRHFRIRSTRGVNRRARWNRDPRAAPRRRHQAAAAKCPPARRREAKRRREPLELARPPPQRSRHLRSRPATPCSVISRALATGTRR